MKKNVLIMTLAALFAIFCSCGSSKEVSKSPVKTYIQPGADLVSGNNLIRGWGMGKSDSEASAHKKAVMNASAALAVALTQTLESTTEEYLTMVSDKDAGISKSLLNSHVKTTINQVLNGATIIFDKWAKDNSDGQKTNYVVMELRGEDFLNELYKRADKDNAKIDRNLLEETFRKHINKAGKTK